MHSLSNFVVYKVRYFDDHTECDCETLSKKSKPFKHTQVLIKWNERSRIKNREIDYLKIVYINQINSWKTCNCI